MTHRRRTSETQERIRKSRDEAAAAIARDYGLQYVDVRPLLDKMTATEVRRILTEQEIKPVGVEGQ